MPFGPLPLASGRPVLYLEAVDATKFFQIWAEELDKSRLDKKRG